MRLVRLLGGLALFMAIGALGFIAPGAHAAVSYNVGVCDPKAPLNCVKPAADGSIAVTGGGGGGSLSATASATPTPVTAGTNKPLNIGLFSNLFATLVDGGGNFIDFSTPSAVTQSGTWAMTSTGAAASGATASGNPLLDGCRAATASPTAVTDGQVIARQCGAEGAAVTRPYAIKELMVRGSTGAIANTTQTSILASAGGSVKNYITAIQCANTGVNTSILTFTDTAATVLINPAGSGGSWTFSIPLVTAAATAFQVTPGTASTNQYCSAQGYTGL